MSGQFERPTFFSLPGGSQQRSQNGRRITIGSDKTLELIRLLGLDTLVNKRLLPEIRENNLIVVKDASFHHVIVD